jgi:hypothetical protein
MLTASHTMVASCSGIILSQFEFVFINPAHGQTLSEFDANR